MLRRASFKPQSFPPAALALAAVALIFPLNFYWQSYLLDADSGGTRFKLVVAGAQIFIFAAPVLFLAWYLKLDWRRTFSLNLPGPRHTLGALLLAFSVVPVSSLIQQLQFSWLPPSGAAEQVFQQQAALLGGGSLLGVLIAFAVIPGICEELVFRGFLLAGLRKGLSTLKLVLLVGLLFGLYHIYVEKIPIVSLMGVLLTLICLRSGSIYLAMLVHMANNGLGIATGRIEALRTFFGLPSPDAALASVQFDARAALFLAVFLVGLSLVAYGRNTHANEPE
jgi:sodium transport system permease protein